MLTLSTKALKIQKNAFRKNSKAKKEIVSTEEILY